MSVEFSPCFIFMEVIWHRLGYEAVMLQWLVNKENLIPDYCKHLRKGYFEGAL